jgi:hypothetical protein
MDLVEMLRPKRKALVTAAEEVAPAIVGQKLRKAQLNHLIGVCGEASCIEEIENYLRYQAAREAPGWTPALADHVIAGVAGIVAELDTDDLKREAWRLYAIFLTRAFTYRDATQGKRGRGR